MSLRSVKRFTMLKISGVFKFSDEATWEGNPRKGLFIVEFPSLELGVVVKVLRGSFWSMGGGLSWQGGRVNSLPLAFRRCATTESCACTFLMSSLFISLCPLLCICIPKFRLLNFLCPQFFSNPPSLLPPTYKK